MKRLLTMLLLWVCCASGALAQQPDFKVSLLGTGSPPPVLARFGPSVLVQAGKETLLFDCGRGCSQRLWQGNVKLSGLDSLFITHLHSDHIVGIPDLWLTGWLVGPYGMRRTPFRVWGPAGTKTLMENLEKAYQWDIDTRVVDQQLPREGVAVVVSEFVEGVVYERNGVRVTAFEVDHGDLVKPAFGYRIDYDGRSVVISGDTKFNENLIRHATGTDLLIHQVAAARPELVEKSEAVRRVLSHHTKPDEAGVVFTRAAPKLAVYYHVSLQGSPDYPPLTEKDVIEMTRATYAGPLEMGQDMMVFVVGKDGVKKQ